MRVSHTVVSILPRRLFRRTTDFRSYRVWISIPSARSCVQSMFDKRDNLSGRMPRSGSFLWLLPVKRGRVCNDQRDYPVSGSFTHFFSIPLIQSSNRTSSGSRQTRRFEDLSYIRTACNGSASVAAKTQHFGNLFDVRLSDRIVLFSSSVRRLVIQVGAVQGRPKSEICDARFLNGEPRMNGFMDER
jgi:hypothetical protein